MLRNLRESKPPLYCYLSETLLAKKGFKYQEKSKKVRRIKTLNPMDRSKPTQTFNSSLSSIQFTLAILKPTLQFAVLAFLTFSLSIERAVFVYLAFKTIYGLISSTTKPLIHLDTLKKHLVWTGLFLPFLYLLFFTLKVLPFHIALFFLISSPAFDPWILKVWMRKRISSYEALFSLLVILGYLLVFFQKSYSSVAPFALSMLMPLLFSIVRVSQKRYFNRDSSGALFWAIPWLFSVALLLPITFKVTLNDLFLALSSGLFLFICQKTTLKPFSKESRQSFSYSTLGIVFTLLFFLESPLTHSFSISNTLILSWTVSLLALFALLFKKNILPNPMDPL